MKIEATIIALLFLTSLSIVHAQAATVDSAMLATDLTSVDASVASAAAAKAGVPVLIAEDGLLNDDLKSQLSSLGVKTVVIVGGRFVIPLQTEQELQQLGYTTIRLWGAERTGTAVAVARHFWPEGASCAVLVDDTKSSDADSRREWAASNLAAKFNCTLVPVPEGTLPAEVLAMLKEMGVSEVHFVGKRFLIADKLREFRTKAIEGDDDEVEAEVETEIENATARAKLKIVIVATPGWKEAIAVGGHPNENSVVRFVTNVSQVQEIIDAIKAKNITDVRVVGIPTLAQQVADLLMQNGINATVVSGEKAARISAELAEKHRAEWKAKHDAEEQRRITLKVKIKGSLNESLAKFTAELDRIEAELDAANVSAPALRAKIDEARTKIADIQAKIDSGELDGARELLAKIKFDLRETRFGERVKLKIDIRIEEEQEEGDVDTRTEKVRESLDKLERNLIAVKQRCSDPTVVEELFAKARSLHAAIKAARAAGNWTGAAENLEEVHDLVETAHGIAESCRQSGELSEVARGVAKRKGIEISSGPAREFVVEADDNGFYMEGQEVTVINVSKGERVKIEFRVRTTSVSNGGLDFKSAAGSLLKVEPGESESLEFTATSDVRITSYWPGSTVRKADLDVNVS